MKTLRMAALLCLMCLTFIFGCVHTDSSLWRYCDTGAAAETYDAKSLSYAEPCSLNVVEIAESTAGETYALANDYAKQGLIYQAINAYASTYGYLDSTQRMYELACQYATDQAYLYMDKRVGVDPFHPSGDRDIPLLFIDGDISELTIEKNSITASYVYVDCNMAVMGYVKIKYQGNSTLFYPKKNFSLKLYEDAELNQKQKVNFKDWGKQNKFVLKANYADITQSRNIISSRLWADCVQSRADFFMLPEALQNAPNAGAIDGFFVRVYINGAYQGRYTLNIPKDEWAYGMEEEDGSEAVICSEDYFSGCFGCLAKLDGTDWTLEYPDEMTDAIYTGWNDAIDFVMNATDAEFKADITNHFNLNSLIDYYCFSYFSCGIDALGKNQVFLTYDGGKTWIACMYDLDATWGLSTDGSYFVDAETNMQEEYESNVTLSGHLEGGNLLYNRLKQNFTQEIYARYQELRIGVLSDAHCIQRFQEFLICSEALVQMDYRTHPEIPCRHRNSPERLEQFILDRAAFVDDQMAGLIGEKYLKYLYATYTDGAIPVHGKLNMDSLTVIARYSDSSEEILADDAYSIRYDSSRAGVMDVSIEREDISTVLKVQVIADDDVLKPLYRLDGKMFDGSSYIDTGIPVFMGDRSYTMLLIFTPNQGNGRTQTALNTVAGCIDETDVNYPGAGIMVQWGAKTFAFAHSGMQTALLKTAQSDITAQDHDSVMLALTYDAEDSFVTLFRNDGTIAYMGHVQPTDTTLTIGGYQYGAPGQVRGFIGEVNTVVLYDGVLDIPYLFYGKGPAQIDHLTVSSSKTELQANEALRKEDFEVTAIYTGRLKKRITDFDISCHLQQTGIMDVVIEYEGIQAVYKMMVADAARTPVYEKENLIFCGENSIDTGIRMLNGESSYTLVVLYTQNEGNAQADGSMNTVLACTEEEDAGFTLQISWGNDYYIVGHDGGQQLDSIIAQNQQAYKEDYNTHSLIVAYDAVTKIISFYREDGTVLYRGMMETLRNETLVLGSWPDGERGWYGTINKIIVYDTLYPDDGRP